MSKEFIVGARDQVTGYYGASCCHTKVDIIATDVLGNSITKTIDVEKSKIFLKFPLSINLDISTVVLTSNIV